MSWLSKTHSLTVEELELIFVGLKVYKPHLGVGVITGVTGRNLAVQYDGQATTKLHPIDSGLSELLDLSGPSRFALYRRVAKGRQQRRRVEARRDAAQISLDPLLHWLAEIKKEAASHLFSTQPPTSADLKLTSLWRGRESSKSEGNLARLISARIAETSVAKHLLELGRKVEDVSITQLEAGPDIRWRSYDLLVDGIPWDVKNARRGRHNKDSYVRHCVPSFKSARSGMEVYVAGVLSEYLRVEELKAGRGQVLFLGVTNYDLLHNLQRRFSKPGVLTIDFGMPGRRESFLPPWCYSLPPSLWQEKNVHRQSSREALSHFDGDFQDVRLSPIACAIACEAPEPFSAAIGKLSDSQRKTADYFWRNCAGEKGTLPTIYLSLLTHFLEELHSDRAQCPTDEYRAFLFPSVANSLARNPLSAHDPLSVIHSFIALMDALWNHHRDSLKRYRCWELKRGNVLRAATGPMDRWDSIVAYCGGWLDDTSPCTRSPLVFGEHETCPRCGYLVCDICDTCKEHCERQKRGARPLA